MIIEFLQTERSPRSSYVFESISGEVIAKTTSTYRNGIVGLECQGKKYFLNLNVKRKEINGAKQKVSELKMEDALYAEIFPAVAVLRKVLFIPIGYVYTVLLIEGQEYRCYEVGIGKKQHYFCVFRGETTVAVIHKADIVKNCKNTYVIYIDDKYVPYIGIIALSVYIDTFFCHNFGDLAAIGTEDTSYYSAQKEVREKYDPGFIPRIKAMDGIND